MSIAHKIGEKTRTGDVLISEEIDFSSLLLSDHVIQGLHNCGFERPSPIQLKAIPLGRCGLDLIVQAKSGTGKTCVFAVVSLESIQVQSSAVQVLVLAPTREIAVQIWEVIKSIGGAMSALRCHTFIGGLPLSEDKQKLKKCHIAVGSPGRIKQLIETGLMKTDSVRLFVLDEADKLLEDSFQEQINWIYSALPDNKQMLALSATYPESLAQHLTRYMRNPTFMRLNISDPALLGIRQFYKTVAYSPMPNLAFEAKTKAVVDLLSGVSFQQCLVFSNLQTRAQNLSDELQSRGWPTACIAGSHEQKDRIEAMSKLKSYKCRVLISTDLTSRGIDADKVNLVINLDVPQDHETYLHRIGRAGRFGSFGAAVTIVSCGHEELELRAVERKCNTHIQTLPDSLPMDLLKPVVPVKLDDVVSTEQLITRPDTESCDQQPDNQNMTSDNKESDDMTNQEQAVISEDSRILSISNGHVETSVKCEQAEENVSQDSVSEAKSPKNPTTHKPLEKENRKSELSARRYDDLQPDSESCSPQLDDVDSKDRKRSHVSHPLSASSLSEKEHFSRQDSWKMEAEPAEVNSPENTDTKRINHSDSTSYSKHQVHDNVSDSKVNTSGRQIAKARRKRKIPDNKETDVNGHCSQIKEPSHSPTGVDIESRRGSESEFRSIQSVLSRRCRDKHQSQDKPILNFPCLRETIGCERLHKPHSYTSALVDYEKFLEEGENVEPIPDISDLIKGKIDSERKISSENKVFTRQIHKCIDQIYSCALSEAVRKTSDDVPDEKTQKPPQAVQVSLPCVQKCSKSTQTSMTNHRYTSRPKVVRYHPMSVSSLTLVDSGTVADERVDKNTGPERDSAEVVGDFTNGFDAHGLENKPRSDFLPKDQLSGKRHEEYEQDQTMDVNALMGHLVEEVANTEITRNDCELMYVSDRVGKISLASDAVTVERELLKTLSSRPKSRKGKITADLDGNEFGRICSRRATVEEVEYCDVNGMKEELVRSSEELDTSDSDSDSSSSSSDYEREVFRNNYVDDPTMANQRLQYLQAHGDMHAKRRKSKSQRNYYLDDSFENNYFYDGYLTNDYQYDQENANLDYNHDEQGYDFYNPGEADSANQIPWHIRHPQQDYYSPYQYFPPQYYPNPYWQNWYPPQFYPYPHHFTPGFYPTSYNNWVRSDGVWGQPGRSDEERIDAMKRNMELQRKYIRKMAKRK